MRPVATIVVLLACGAAANRVKRQDQELSPEDNLKLICDDKEAGTWFRLQVTEKCDEVVQCTSGGLQKIKCPTSLAFDLSKQACDWKNAVHDCKLTVRPKLAKPRLNTEEALCVEANQIACGDSECLHRELFCDGKVDCADGSDENICDMENDPNRAPPCDPVTCTLPTCFCSDDGTTIPGRLNKTEVPQMIMLTFNGAINNNNIDLFDDLFSDEYLNPNGCPIKGTFFVSHKYTNYTAVQDMHDRGHEIAVFSISQNDTESYWNNASRLQWAQEMSGQRQIVEKFAGINDNSVVGMRTPYLRVGGNNQFFMMEEYKFLYDSTITAPLSDRPVWPYTLLNRMPHVCHGNLQHCPTRAFPVWEMVMNELDRREDPSIDGNLPGCAQVDSCSSLRTGEHFYNFLNINFDRHYLTNRAPLALNFHSAWLKKDNFIDYLLYWIAQVQKDFPDVYFVTMTQVIEWIQETPVAEATKNFEPWLIKCDAPLGFPCSRSGGNNCPLHSPEVQGTYNMQTCQRCPPTFPWLNNPDGDGI